MFLALWKSALHRRYWVFGVGVLILMDTAAVGSSRGAPFWIAALGTPDYGVYVFSFIWIVVNTVFNWIAIDWLWHTWSIWSVHWRLKGWSTQRSWRVLWRFALSSSTALVLFNLVVCALVSLLVRRSLGTGDWTHMVPMAALWVLGINAMSWLSFLLGVFFRNPYVGYVAASAVVLFSGYGFPHILWSPGAQWMYGAHQTAGSPSYLDSFVYLALLNAALGVGAMARALRYRDPSP